MRVWALLPGITLLVGSAVSGDRLFLIEHSRGLQRFDLPDPAKTTLAVRAVGHGDGTCSPDGQLYFGSHPNGGRNKFIQSWDQEGIERGILEMPPGVYPTGIAFDAAGDLWIWTGSDSSMNGGGLWLLPRGDLTQPPRLVVPPPTPWNGTIAEVVAGGPHAGALLLGTFDPARLYLSEPPGSAPRLFIELNPLGASALMAAITDDCGNIIVGYGTDQWPRLRIERFDPDGRLMEMIETWPWFVDELALDSEENLYFLSKLNGRVQRVSSDRTLSIFYDHGLNVDGMALCRAPLTCSAGGPYQAECDGRRTCLTLSAPPVTGCAEYTWTTTCPGGDFAGTEHLPTPTLCLHSTSCPTSCSVRLDLRKGLRSASSEAEVRVEDTTPPVLIGVPADETVECDRVPAPAPVVTHDRCDPAPKLGFSESRRDGSCPGNYELTRIWRAQDSCGSVSETEQRVTVRDTTAPEVNPGASDLQCLWPPNHRYVCFGLGDFAPEVSDRCSDPVAWRFQACPSDQPDDADESEPRGPWGGDGETAGDCVVAADGGEICVRAERAGRGPTALQGRRYAVEIVATDSCGNAGAPVRIGYVHVPHDRSSTRASCR